MGSGCFLADLQATLCSVRKARVKARAPTGRWCKVPTAVSPALRRSPAPRMIAHREGVGRRAAHVPPRRPPHLPSTQPGLLPSPCRERRRVPGAALSTLLQTCVPPAATQDTRGRSSARVSCCSPRSHTVSWGAPPAGPCPASSSRWTARLPLDELELLCTGTSKLENRRRRWDWVCTQDSRGKATASAWGSRESPAPSPAPGSAGAVRSR